jgi:hypothetical protein
MPKPRIVRTSGGRYPVATRPGRQPGNPNWVPGHHQPGSVPFTPESRAAMTEPPIAPGPRFSALVRRATAGGAELIAFMLAVLRGDVARLLHRVMTAAPAGSDVPSAGCEVSPGVRGGTGRRSGWSCVDGAGG